MGARERTEVVVAAMKDLEASVGWGMLVTRLKEYQERSLAAEDRVASWDEHLEARGYRRALRDVLREPEQILQQARAALKDEPGLP